MACARRRVKPVAPVGCGSEVGADSARAETATTGPPIVAPVAPTTLAVTVPALVAPIVAALVAPKTPGGVWGGGGLVPLPPALPPPPPSPPPPQAVRPRTREYANSWIR